MSVLRRSAFVAVSAILATSIMLSGPMLWSPMASAGGATAAAGGSVTGGSTAGVPTAAAGIGALQAAAASSAPAPKVVLRAAGPGPRTFVPPPPRPHVTAPSLTVAPPATITVRYTGFTPAAQTAFQAAVDIWARTLSSPVPIVVDASFTALGAGILGSAGPSALWRDFAGAPKAGTFYVQALADALHGSAVSPGTSDIAADFSSAFPNWYFGTDGNTPAGSYDFETVVLHELGHGLGFIASMDFVPATGQGTWGIGTPPAPTSFDPFVVSTATPTVRLIDLATPSIALASQEQSGQVSFNGPLATAANGGIAPKLFAPNPWQDGSSIAHWDPTAFPSGTLNSLMDPAIGTGTAIHDQGPVLRGAFGDVGWVVAGAPRRAPGDFDGDGRTDTSVFRPSTGSWFTIKSGGGASFTNWGTAGDIPVPGDYDGDGKADVAVFRPSTGTWWIINSGGGVSVTQWGTAGDIPVPGDYDGDGKTDIAVFRPSTGSWFVIKSAGGSSFTNWGTAGDIPVPGDYNGDGKTDVAVFRPSTGTWWIINSGGGISVTNWGTAGDIPIGQPPGA